VNSTPVLVDPGRRRIVQVIQQAMPHYREAALMGGLFYS
jgi:hypothetical protein